MSFASEQPGSFHYRAWIAGLLGLALAAWMLRDYGVVAVVSVLARVGWFGGVVIVAFHAVQLLPSAEAWRVISAPGGTQGSLRTYSALRWIREGVNNLLPLAQIGGEFVAVRLLQRRGVRLGPAVAGTLVDLLVEIKTQILFTVLGLMLLVSYAGHSRLSRLLAIGLLGASLCVAILVIALRAGLAAAVERGALRLGRMFGWPAAADISGLHDALQACYRARRHLALGASWHLLSWVLGGLEVWLVMHFFRHDVGFGVALTVESLGQVAKSLGFAIPGAVGVQEGGYALVCGVLGVSPELGLALSLAKRVREVIWGVPALVFWQQQRTENSTRAVRLSLGSIRGGDQ